MTISVIIPVLNDAPHLEQALGCLPTSNDDIQVLVVDGGSVDGSRELAESIDSVILVDAAPGRARQMNEGARVAEGELLLFLHADTRLPPDWPQAVRSAAGRPRFKIGAFRFRLNGSRLSFRLLEFGVYVRTLILRLPYGDQALFMRAEDFRALGGFPDSPIMEDVELVRRARHIGRLIVLNDAATTSARNWESDGVLRRTQTNLSCLLRYFRGHSLKAIAASYRTRRRGIILFCKASEPGNVKTRLAATIGDQRAVAIYKHMVGRTLIEAHACKGCPRLLVCHTPVHTGPMIKQWLGAEATYIAQADGDLGHRMQKAFEHAFRMGLDEVLIVGTDCPALTRTHLSQAFEQLAHADVTLGPTDDGGYYLIGARKVHPSLFTDIAWSTESVFSQTMQVIEANDLTCDLLPQLRDLDTEDDLGFYDQRGYTFAL